MTRLICIALVLVACRGGVGSADDVCAYEFGNDAASGGARTIGTMVPDLTGDPSVHVALRWPDGGEAASAPVGITVQGGWNHEGTPVGKDSPRLDTTQNIVDVHFDLPEAGFSTGTNDRRGPIAAAALAAVLDWAAGVTTDIGGCTLADRAPMADPDALYLVGISNGGNLAVSALTDPDLSLPPIAGLVTWETPVAASFVNVELGNDPSVYEPDSCTADPTLGIRCDFDSAALATQDDGPTSTVCFDLDGDDGCGDADVTVNSTEAKETGERVLSPEMRQAIDDRGLDLDGYADVDECEAWWGYRNASLRVGDLVTAWPEMPFMLIGSEEDHVLTSWPDHPHIYGWGELLQTSGAFWTRLNPGQDYLASNSTENPPNASLSLAGSDAQLLTEDAENPLEAVLTAAVMELYFRRVNDDW